MRTKTNIMLKVIAIIAAAFALYFLVLGISIWNEAVVAIAPPSFVILISCIVLIGAIFMFGMKK